MNLHNMLVLVVSGVVLYYGMKAIQYTVLFISAGVYG